MRNFIRKWLGMDELHKMICLNRKSLIAIEEYLEARESCKICGHHRYIKENDV